MSADDREEIYRSSNQGLRETLQNQLAAHRNLNERAIDLVKIDLLAASVIVSGVTISGSSAVLPYLAASTTSFLYAIWASVRVFRPRGFSRGLGPEDVKRIEGDVSDGMPPDVHHEQMMLSYRDAVSDTSGEYLNEVELFGNATWASVAGVMFAVVTAGASLLKPPTVVAIPAYVIVPVLCFWGKEKYGFDGNGEP